MKIRIYIGVAAILVALANLALVSASRPATPGAPSHLVQLAASKPVAAASWINHTRVEVRFQIIGTGARLTPQVEWRPVTQSLTGQPTTVHKPVSLAAGTAKTVKVWIHGLHDGVGYAWQARVVDDSGNAGPWTKFTSRGPALSVDLSPPTQPRISSSTNPRSGSWYNTHTERFSWKSTDAGSGIAGYSVRVDHSDGGRPGSLAQSATATLHNLADGRWVLHVWAVDQAGNWSRPGTYRFNLDTTPAKVSFAGVDHPSLNPYAGRETWRFTTTKSAQVNVDVMRSGQRAPVVTEHLGTLGPGTHTFVWNGRDGHGHIVARGWYWIHVFTNDSLGNRSNFAFGGVRVAPQQPTSQSPFTQQPDAGKVIIVSLSRQTLYAYDGNRLVLSTLVTTGNPALPTPTGHFAIFAKFSPFEFISPWPQGSPYYYPPSWTTYAMEFISGGYFIHDAPWRSVFGPGSNGPGQPGTNYGGTHGCVNTPFAAAQFLWNWAPIGTPVDVVP